MEDGKLVPDELMIGLVMHEATPHLDNGKSLLLDGFPRTVAQAKALEEVKHLWSTTTQKIVHIHGDIDFIAGNLGLNTKFYRNGKEDLCMLLLLQGKYN